MVLSASSVDRDSGICEVTALMELCSKKWKFLTTLTGYTALARSGSPYYRYYPIKFQLTNIYIEMLKPPKPQTRVRLGGSTGLLWSTVLL